MVLKKTIISAGLLLSLNNIVQAETYADKAKNIYSNNNNVAIPYKSLSASAGVWTRSLIYKDSKTNEKNFFTIYSYTKEGLGIRPKNTDFLIIDKNLDGIVDQAIINNNLFNSNDAKMKDSTCKDKNINPSNQKKNCQAILNDIYHNSLDKIYYTFK